MRSSSRQRRASDAGAGGEEEVADDCASMVDTEGCTEDGEAGQSQLTVQQLRDRLARAGASVPRAARKAELVSLLEACKGEDFPDGRAAGVAREAELASVAQQLKVLQKQVDEQKKREAEMVRQQKAQEERHRLLAEEHAQEMRWMMRLEDERLKEQRRERTSRCIWDGGHAQYLQVTVRVGGGVERRQRSRMTAAAPLQIHAGNRLWGGMPGCQVAGGGEMRNSCRKTTTVYPHPRLGCNLCGRHWGSRLMSWTAMWPGKRGACCGT